MVVVAPMIIVHRVQRAWLRFKNGGQHGQQQSYRSTNYNNSPPHRQKSQRKKVFDKTDGEYVEFEEITVTNTSRTTNSNDDIYYEREEQVTDAEWVEIK